MEKDTLRRWLFQMRVNGKWHTRIVQSSQRFISIRATKTFPDAIAVTAIDGGGNTSTPSVLGRKSSSVPSPAMRLTRKG